MVTLQFMQEGAYKSPYVRFDKYGQQKQVAGDVAVRMLEAHPDKFKLVEGKLPEIPVTETGNTIPIEFVRDDDDIKKYNNAFGVRFEEYGEIKDVEASVAELMLKMHPTKFKKVDNSDSDYADIIAVLNKQPQTIKEIAHELGVSWHSLTFKLNRMVDEGLIVKDENPDNQKVYSLKEEG